MYEVLKPSYYEAVWKLLLLMLRINVSRTMTRVI